MRAVATADTSSSSSAAGSRTLTACRIELRFIALGALESKGGVATPGPSIRPARFFGELPTPQRAWASCFIVLDLFKNSTRLISLCSVGTENFQQFISQAKAM